MVGTKTFVQEQQRCFQKLLVETLLLPDDSPIIRAFRNENIETINYVLNVNDFDIDLFKYVKENEETDSPEKGRLSQGHRGWIRILIAFIKHLDLQSENQLEDINIDAFNEYIFLIYDPNGNPSSSNNTSNKPSGSKINKNNGDSFKKGTKRDKSQYPVLKHDWQWNNWNCTTVSTAKTHLCHEVFNPTYMSKTKEERLHLIYLIVFGTSLTPSGYMLAFVL